MQPKSRPEARLRILRGMHILGAAADAAEICVPPALARKLEPMIENCIGAFPVPLGIAGPLCVNHRSGRVLTMATDEQTVVAACAKAVQMSQSGFLAGAGRAVMPAQIMVAEVGDVPAALSALHYSHPRLQLALDTVCARHHGGSCTATIEKFRFVGLAGDVTNPTETLIVVDLKVYPGDRMGAGLTTSIAERFAPEILAVIDQHAASVSICCNKDAGRQTKVEALFIIPGGEARRNAMVRMNRWARIDPDRAATDIKGIMNAVDAVALATGQDTRAVAASAGAVNAFTPYTPVTLIPVGENRIRAHMTLTLPVGTVGGATEHPAAARCRKMMRIEDADDLAAMIASAGLAQNIAALHALTGEGITASRAAVRKPRSNFLGKPIPKNIR